MLAAGLESGCVRGERGVVHLVRAAQGRGGGDGDAGEDMQTAPVRFGSVVSCIGTSTS